MNFRCYHSNGVRKLPVLKSVWNKTRLLRKGFPVKIQKRDVLSVKIDGVWYSWNQLLMEGTGFEIIEE